jgi:hypothetical protein
MASAQSPYSEADLNRMQTLTAFGYDTNMPNSYASQQALLKYASMGTNAPTTTVNSVSADPSANTTVAQTSTSGITDQSVIDNLIKQAVTTPSTNTARVTAADTINQQLQDYSKASAFSDSQALSDAAIQKALLAFAPGMNRGMQAAGQSGSSMQALLSEKAASDAALNAAQLGATQATNYGQITSSIDSALNNITQTDTAAQDSANKAAELLKTSSSTPTVVDTTATTGPNTVMNPLSQAYLDWQKKVNG